MWPTNFRLLTVSFQPRGLQIMGMCIPLIFARLSSEMSAEGLFLKIPNGERKTYIVYRNIFHNIIFF